MFKHITVIVNPIAGGKKNKRQLIERLTNLLSREGRNISVRYTEKRGDATQLSQAAVAENADLVVVVGGDGTINEAGSALVKTDVPMAIVPQGSGNGLARTLRIPSDVAAATGLINEGVISAIDVGKANDRYFFMLMGIGFDAAIGEEFNAHSARGPLPYFYLGAKKFFSYRPSKVKMSFQDNVIDLAPFLITIANAQQFGNNALIAPHAILNDGLLDVCIVHHLSFFDLFSMAPKLFSGRVREFSGIEFHKTETVCLERERANVINLDGEAVPESAVVNISVLPRSLKIVTPQSCPALVR